MSRILIVEDSPTQAKELKLILESNGLDVESAQNAEAGLERLASGSFELVLADILLPGIDGYELCRRIKTDPRTRGISVVLLTVLRDPLEILRGLECGADNYLTKPYDPAFLLSRVQHILANRAERLERPGEAGVSLAFRGKGITITSDKEQIVDLLLSAVEDSIRARERELEARIAKEATERSERFIRAALDALTTRVAVMDGTGTVIAVNAAWHKLVKAAPWLGAGCVVGSNYLSACEADPDPRGAELALAIREVMARKRDGFVLEYASVRDNDQAWFNAGVVRLEDAGPVRVVVTHSDVTDGKKLESTLRQRAQELTEESERRRNFQAMMAHELRNPLAPILSSLHVARLASVTPEVRDQSLETAERQTRHLRRLVDDLLESSRLELGKVQLHAERLDLARLVRRAVEDNRRVVESLGVTLNADLPETPVWVQGDPGRLTQIVTNLLDNAKFTEAGGSMFVRVTADAASESAVLTIRDTGIGISPEALRDLFQPFRQADQGLARSRGGLGLGLFVVKDLVELHGGSVSATSGGIGKGAEFTIRLPLVPEPAALSAPPAAVDVGRRGTRVLVVEDNRDSADSLRMLLEILGHEVQVAHTGPEGVRVAKAWVPDIVICDIGLPGLDGYGVARELHLNPITSRVRLLALSGYGSEEDRDRSRQAGFIVHLTKPVDPLELQQYLVAKES
jgi:signal transduction histidine kinase/response regulator of citrate/malate metabolism